MRSDYEHSNRHKYYLKCHLIFCIKYRKKLLVGKFNDTIKCILKGIAEKSDFDIEIMESDKDHCCSIGEASPETIRKYIEQQG